MSDNRIEIVNGKRRAVFVRGADGWTPDWFYEGDRPMLRFKDHEWLSLGHIHPTAASSGEKIGNKAVFRGEAMYGSVKVAWSVTVKPDRACKGFMIETEFTPDGTIELMESFTSYETPYEYDGTEHVTTVIGQNPITQWKGDQRITPKQWAHPMWCYNRDEYVHMTGPCDTPLLVQTVANPDGSNARYTAIVGDWNVCSVHEAYATCTRTVKASDREWSENARDDRRGYKYIVAGVNWSSSLAKDPNIMYEAKRHQRQRLYVTFGTPQGNLDELLMAAWHRAAAIDMPDDGAMAMHDQAVSRGATWTAAVRWLRDLFTHGSADGLFYPDRGIRTYAPGTRPKAGEDFSWGWWPQWAGYFHYRALLTNDTDLKAACERYDENFAQCSNTHVDADIVNVSFVPAVKWAATAGKGSPLAAAVRPSIEASYAKSVAENGGPRRHDPGNQASRAEMMLLATQAYDDPKFAAQGLLLVEEMNAELDNRFWSFGCTSWADLSHGGQPRPMGYGHAIAANVRAFQRTRDAKFLAAARRFTRLLISTSVMTHDGSPAPDYDWRGWCHGTMGGRDQHAQCPPWETSNALMCMIELMAEQDLESGCYDTLWYYARTGLAQFPKARTHKRIWDPTMKIVRFVPREKLVSERDFYDVLPFLAYENPADQTLLASYQGSDCLEGELLFGGGLATADDGRLIVLVPHAAQMDPAVTNHRTIKVWNPTAKPIDTTIRVVWPDGTTASQPLKVPSRELVMAEFVK